MSELAELDAAVMELNELYQLCTDEEQREKILEIRDTLDDLAGKLANKSIEEGSDELDTAILALIDLTREAELAKSEVDDIAAMVHKTADVINNAAKAIKSVAVLVA